MPIELMRVLFLGGDDKKVRIWKTVDCFVNDTPKPYSLTNTHLSNIFALRFSHLTDRGYNMCTA
jgi:hypothetical protein